MEDRHGLDIEPLYSLPEAGRILGFEKSTMYSRVRAGRIKAIELDGMKRIPRSELLRYIRSARPVSA